MLRLQSQVMKEEPTRRSHSFTETLCVEYQVECKSRKREMNYGDVMGKVGQTGVCLVPGAHMECLN